MVSKSVRMLPVVFLHFLARALLRSAESLDGEAVGSK
jgi:hypothetical protein